MRWREIAIVFQSAMNALNPVLTCPRPARRRDRRAPADRRGRSRETAGSAARPRRHPARAAAQLPPRAVRRHAPAGDDRDGAGRRPRGRHHGRADDRARRGRAARDPRPDRRAEGAPRLRRSCSSPTTCRCCSSSPTASRSCTPGSSSRSAARERDPPRAVAPLHQGAARLVPARCAARAGSSPASPAHRLTCATCRPAARSCRAALTARTSARDRHAPCHVRTRADPATSPRARSCCRTAGPSPPRRRGRRQPQSPEEGDAVSDSATGHQPPAADASRPGVAAACRGALGSPKRPQPRLPARPQDTSCTPSGTSPSASTRARSSRSSARAAQASRRSPDAGRPGATDAPATILLDGGRSTLTGRRAFRRYKSEVQMVFQDPFASLNPVHTVRYHLERPCTCTSAQGPKRRGRARPR